MEEALVKRVLPHSVEAEQSVIGSMLMDRDAIIAASEIVVADDFYQRQYGIMFDTMVERTFAEVGTVARISRTKSRLHTSGGTSFSFSLS